MNAYPQPGYVMYPQQPQMPMYPQNMYGTMANTTPYANANNPQHPQMTQFLTPEQMSELQLNPQLFPTKLTRDEYLRSICCHKNRDTITLEPSQNGNQHCSICQADFYLFRLDTPESEINEVCKNMHDLLQSIKTYLLNAPDALKDIYMMLGFIQKIPLLWNTAVKSFEAVSNGVNFGNVSNNPNSDPFQLLGNLFGGNMVPGMGGYYQQPTVPPMAMYQQPTYSQPGFGALPNQPPPQAPVAPNAYANQQYGFTPPPMQQPVNQPYMTPPTYTPNPASNPIGYVDNSNPQQMTTQNVQIGGAPPQQPLQTPVTQPTNPNIQPPPPPPTVDNKK